MHRACLGLLLLFSLGLSGCSVAPAQEMSDARLAVQAAREAGAERYSGEWLEAAGGELAVAEKAIASQRFDSARQHAQVARGLALAARNNALLAIDSGNDATPSAGTRATTTALVDASRRASASGDIDEAVRLAEEAARVSAAATVRSAP